MKHHSYWRKKCMLRWVHSILQRNFLLERSLIYIPIALISFDDWKFRLITVHLSAGKVSICRYSVCQLPVLNFVQCITNTRKLISDLKIMDLLTVLFVCLLLFVFLISILYIGVTLTFFSSVALATIICLVILNLFYPPNRLFNQKPTVALILYGAAQVLGILFLLFYIILKSSKDYRCL